MNKLLGMLLLLLLLQACNDKVKDTSFDSMNWNKRTIDDVKMDSLSVGSTYLSAYAQIHSQFENKMIDLTATVSMRNTNLTDTIYIDKAAYYDTHGELIRTYIDKTIFIAPMETVEIIIHETDREGGTGANFLFDWKIKPSSHEPLFEAVMISTSGQQGISFTTQGKRIN